MSVNVQLDFWGLDPISVQSIMTRKLGNFMAMLCGIVFKIFYLADEMLSNLKSSIHCWNPF